MGAGANAAAGLVPVAQQKDENHPTGPVGPGEEDTAWEGTTGEWKAPVTVPAEQRAGLRAEEGNVACVSGIAEAKEAIRMHQQRYQDMWGDK